MQARVEEKSYCTSTWVEEVRRLVIKGEDTFGKKVWIQLLSALSEEVLVLQ
jgi:hypothetical protein